MSLVFWPQKDLAYHPFFINDEACTVKTHVLSPIEIFLSPNPIFIDDSVFWISQKSEWKVEFLSELLVLFRVIRTNAYHREAFLFQQVITITQIAGLNRAGGSIILRIKV